MTDQRDAAGRFAPGCRGGPGSPLARQAAGRAQAFRSAITDDDLRDVARILLAQALDGDVGAARELLARCCGRVDLDLPAEGAGLAGFEFGDLSSATGIADGMRRVLTALGRGEVDMGAAAGVLAMLDVAGRAIERSTFEERLTALEARQDGGSG